MSELKQAAHEIRMALTPVIEGHKQRDTPDEWRRWYLGRISPFGHQAGLIEAYTFAEREMGSMPPAVTQAFSAVLAAMQVLDDVIQAEVRK